MPAGFTDGNKRRASLIYRRSFFMEYYFGEFLWDDLFSNRKAKWLNKIMSNVSQKAKPKWDVLDVGFGFFSVLLGELGHTITTISHTGYLLDTARMYAGILGVEMNSLKMDSHVLDFPDDCFDLIVSRDFTWMFRDPVKAYSEWKRVLRPGGKILIFDANYGLFCFDNEIAVKKQQYEDVYRKNYGILPSGTICENRIRRMFFSNKRRPAWDIAAFSNLDMAVSAEIELSNELSSENNRLLNGAAPLFLITAEKIHELETKKTERTIHFREDYCKVTTIRWE
jgi:SAM-dependent methyltransferase